MLEFQTLSVKVANVSMGRLVFLFTEVLEEPLKVLVKSHKPTNLNDAMSLTRDLQNVLPRTRFPPKPNFIFERKPWKKDAHDKKFWQKDTSEKNKKEGQNRDELRRKQLCFTCFQLWTLGHKCAKGKARYIEVFLDNDEYEGGMDEEVKISNKEEEYETEVEEEKQE